MKNGRSRLGWTTGILLLIVLLLFRPGAFQLHNRIGRSIGNALGRRVTIDNVRLHALPRPGFDLEGLVIYDDPAFSAEPMIRAQEVFAAIRFRSLLRGRLEIATLSATEPSINIVRSSDGRWNLASLLERNSQIPAAPTDKAGSERRPGFPYLEASNARINFKIGPEKKSYALVEADVALWQDSENSWGARMKAQPIRTDFNLTDTGQVRLDATWQRAVSLRTTPLRLIVSWENGQLGQITKLLTGKDRGWRGGVDLTANMQGTPESLGIESQGAIQGFRRYDILDNRSIRLATRCSGRYNALTVSIGDLLCESPVGNGRLRISGNAGAIMTPRSYDVTVAARDVPVAAVVALAHEAKQKLADDLSADGVLNGEFHAVGSGAKAARLSGSGEAREVHLRSNGGKDSIVLRSVPLSLVADESCCGGASTRRGAGAKARQGDPEPAEAHLRIGPAPVSVNASAPISAGGWASINGYRFFVRGDLDFKNLFRIENTLGVPALQPLADGSVRLDMSLSGGWQGLAPPNALGTAQLRNVRAEARGLNTPIEIAAATVTLAANRTFVQQISARTGGTHWTGSVRAARHCAPGCLYEFDLAADKLSTGDLAEWLAPHLAQRPWYRILGGGGQFWGSEGAGDRDVNMHWAELAGRFPLLALQARGNLRVAQFTMKKAVATQVTTGLTADHGRIKLDHLRGQVLQGTYQGTWTIDAGSLPVKYHGIGVLQNVSLERLSGLMNDNWITGIGDATFDVNTAGASFQDMVANSDGTLQFAMQNGTFAHVELPGMASALPVYRFTGNLQVKSGKWQLSAGRLESRDGIYQVSGAYLPASGMNFNFTRGDEHSWNLTGTIAKPRVAPANQEISRTEPETKSVVKP
ncbi:MAG: AsmA family protein [Terriglobales bacterium]